MSLTTFVKGLFSAPKIADTAADIAKTAVDGIYHGVDALIFTDEEKVEARQKGFATILSFWNTFASENSAQSTARREIAKQVMKVWLALILLGVIAYPWEPAYSRFLFEIVKDITWLVGMIAATYFVPHQLSKIVDFRKKD